MSQPSRLTRARQLTAGVLPGRGGASSAGGAAARLRKIAADGGAGAVTFTGQGGGRIHFRDGRVIYAESPRTPALAAGQPGGPAPQLGAGRSDRPGRSAGLGGSTGTGRFAGTGPSAGTWGSTGPLPEPAGRQASAAVPEPAGGPTAGGEPAGGLGAALAVAESALDAALEILSGESRCSRLRPSPPPAAEIPAGIAVEALLAEVARRQRLLHQLSPVITADTPVGRCARIEAPAIRVSAWQWALIIRARDGATPRDLAWALNRSVFGTLTEVYRLMTLRLLTAEPDDLTRAGRTAGPGHQAELSFLRAVSGQKGDPMPDVISAASPGAGR